MACTIVSSANFSVVSPSISQQKTQVCQVQDCKYLKILSVSALSLKTNHCLNLLCHFSFLNGSNYSLQGHDTRSRVQLLTDAALSREFEEISEPNKTLTRCHKSLAVRVQFEHSEVNFSGSFHSLISDSRKFLKHSQTETPPMLRYSVLNFAYRFVSSHRFELNIDFLRLIQ
jgi:hypothetical protein